MGYYKAEKVDDNITKIVSLTGELLYLIEGKDKAVLVDTCLGVGNLKEFVQGLTNKPITVILTHGHVDHAMGAPEFHEVYLNDKDIEVFKKYSPLEVREDYISMNLRENMPKFIDEDYVKPDENMGFNNLEDGDNFDLGEINLQVFKLSGHTKGSMVILIKEKKILILGDACNTATFLFDDDALTVEGYRENLIQINRKLKGLYDRVFLSHHDMEANSNIIDNVIEVCNKIMSQKADDVPFEFMGQCNYIAKAIGKNFKRLDGKEGNIIYNKDKIYKY